MRCRRQWRLRASIYDPATQPELFDGVLSKRIVAFFIDADHGRPPDDPRLAAWCSSLGIVTLGLGWLLFAPLFAIVALGYVGAHPRRPGLGDRRHAPQRASSCGPGTARALFPLLAVMHALLFWLSVSVLTPLILLVGLFT